MKKKLIIYFIIITGFQLSCKSQINNETPILVTKITNNDFSSITFKYDENKLVETEDGELKSVYSYTGNLITQIKDYHDTELIKTADFNYNKVGKLIMIKVSGIDEYVGPKTPFTETYTLDYPSSNLIECTIIRSYHYIEESVTDTIQTRYTLEKGNIILSQDLYKNNDSELKLSQSYIYDNKNNPYQNILGYDKIRVYTSYTYDESLTGNNNVLSYEIYQEDVPRDVYGSSASFKIVYNEDNFPIQILSKIYNRDGVASNGIVYSYTYNK